MKRETWKAWAIVRNGKLTEWMGKHEIFPRRLEYGAMMKDEKVVRVVITEVRPKRRGK